MKRSVLILCLSLFIPSPVFATHIGGMSLPPGKNRLSFGAHVGYPERSVSSDRNEATSGSIQLLARGEYGAYTRLGLFIEGGVSDLRFKDDGFRGILGGAFGLGMKGVIFDPEEQKTNVCFFLEGLTFKSESSDRRALVFEYQAALLVEFTAENTTTYGGLKVSQMDITLKPYKEKYSSDNNLGALFGMDYLVTPQVYFNGEIQIYDQQAIFVSVGYLM